MQRTNSRVPSPISIVISRNWADVRASLAIAHDTFVESGFQTPLPSGVRLLPAHLNPGSFVVLGLLDGRPAGTIAVTEDGPFGLAADRAFVEEIDQLRGEHRLVELGSFGVHRWARQRSMPLAVHLFSALIWLLRRRSESTFVVGAFDMSAVGFYGRNFGFQPIALGQRPLYREPARLLGGTRREIMSTLEEPGGLRSEIRRLSSEPSPSWMTVNEEAPEWPLAEVAELLAEVGEIERLRGQTEIAAPIIAAYDALVGEEGVPAARERRWLGVASRETPGTADLEQPATERVQRGGNSPNGS